VQGTTGTGRSIVNACSPVSVGIVDCRHVGLDETVLVVGAQFGFGDDLSPLLVQGDAYIP
jgi:hypothetical protein